MINTDDTIMDDIPSDIPSDLVANPGAYLYVWIEILKHLEPAQIHEMRLVSKGMNEVANFTLLKKVYSGTFFCGNKITRTGDKSVKKFNQVWGNRNEGFVLPFDYLHLDNIDMGSDHFPEFVDIIKNHIHTIKIDICESDIISFSMNIKDFLQQNKDKLNTLIIEKYPGSQKFHLHIVGDWLAGLDSLNSLKEIQLCEFERNMKDYYRNNTQGQGQGLMNFRCFRGDIKGNNPGFSPGFIMKLIGASQNLKKFSFIFNDFETKDPQLAISMIRSKMEKEKKTFLNYVNFEDGDFQVRLKVDEGPYEKYAFHLNLRLTSSLIHRFLNVYNELLSELELNVERMHPSELIIFKYPMHHLRKLTITGVKLASLDYVNLHATFPHLEAFTLEFTIYSDISDFLSKQTGSLDQIKYLSLRKVEYTDDVLESIEKLFPHLEEFEFGCCVVFEAFWRNLWKHWKNSLKRLCISFHTVLIIHRTQNFNYDSLDQYFIGIPKEQLEIVLGNINRLEGIEEIVNYVDNLNIMELKSSFLDLQALEEFQLADLSPIQPLDISDTTGYLVFNKMPKLKKITFNKKTKISKTCQEFLAEKCNIED